LELLPYVIKRLDDVLAANQQRQSNEEKESEENSGVITKQFSTHNPYCLERCDARGAASQLLPHKHLLTYLFTH